MGSPGPCFIRQAVWGDSSSLLAWRNDAATRSASRDQSLVDPTDHHRWLEFMLTDDTSWLLVAEDAVQTPIATLRFDRLDDLPDSFEVSITLAPSVRGEGWSPIVLASGEDWLRAHEPVATIVAAVRASNAASLHLFISAGYSLDSQTADLVTLSKRFTQSQAEQ
ncbi:MAG: GNAT family N-acetyltransferase [Candidatus Nanopelagicales bacterium]|nr:GNAT family N-acetyltransferase [Candidatus Nanopelagicales bacterium]MCF8536779.1 GNAT family N-acetyltransferase [Candidatus Nanopelagicales bacterium]MCF8541764.1 GNAT family N-acetyltransferase [Candidatus Nanopelagicales bacterium]MCF8556195.1 GNAT family N-acetyltransferase [Candidatus Nanopelagicales bacterium]